MFERFTDRARRVVVLAQDEARLLNHNYIGTEHILLGLVSEGSGVAARALGTLGITAEAVRQKVEEIIGRGEQAPQAGHIPFTPRAKKVLELSLREAIQLGHNYIGTEHILLGLIREGEGVGAQALTGLGADRSSVRREVVGLLERYRGEEEHGAVRAGRRPEEAGAWSGRRRLWPELRERLEQIEARLSALEKRAGSGPDVRDLDEQIAQVRRDKDAAIEAQDFENAAVLRDREKELAGEKASRQEEWAARHLDLPSLSDEVERLRNLLREHGIEPHNGAA